MFYRNTKLSPDYTALQPRRLYEEPPFWDIMPCSPMKVNRRFAETYRFHLQVRKISREDTSVKAGGNESIILFRY
jgi:hypothetical protein